MDKVFLKETFKFNLGGNYVFLSTFKTIWTPEEYDIVSELFTININYHPAAKEWVVSFTIRTPKHKAYRLSFNTFQEICERLHNTNVSEFIEDANNYKQKKYLEYEKRKLAELARAI